MHNASSARLLASISLVAMSFSTGCVIAVGDDDGYQCDGYGYCCDAYGCWSDGAGTPYGGSPSTGGSAQGGAAQGGSSEGGAGAGGSAPGCDASSIVCACDTVDDCGGPASGLACLDGQCLDACSFDYQCGDSAVCADGRCVDACGPTATCPPGFQCVGGGCLQDPGAPQCLVAEDCASGICVNGLCTTACDDNSGCPDGQLCDAATASCFDDPSVQPACDPQADPCDGSGQSCADDGYCHYGCSTVQDCKLIDARYDACDAGICKTSTEVDPECTFENPCVDGSPCVSNSCVTPQ